MKNFLRIGFGVLVLVSLFLFMGNVKADTTKSTLVIGPEFNARIKSLANGVEMGTGDIDTKIKSFERWSGGEIPSTVTQTGNIATQSSPYPITIWFDTDSGVLYYHTQADEIVTQRNFSQAFRGCSSLESVDGLANRNFENAENMGFSFAGCSNLVDISALSGWNVSRVTSMNQLFHGCEKLSDISPLVNRNTQSLKNMFGLFLRCSSLSNISALGDWEVGSVTEMTQLFQGCAISDLSPLKDWNVSSVTKMDLMFRDCTNITDLSVLSGRDVSSVTNMGQMFHGCENLTDISGLSGRDVSKVISMGYMFCGCNNLEDISALSNRKTASLTNLGSTFRHCYKLQDISPLSNWDVSNVTDMSCMFENAKITDLLPLSNWDVSNVKNMGWMFVGNKELEDISPLGNWDVGSVSRIHRMFGGCEKLKDISALSERDVSNVTDMNAMFIGCKSLEDASGLTNWNVSNVADMHEIFKGCTSLTELDLTNWDTSNVTNMKHMFADCSNLEAIYVSDKFNTNAVTESSSMFTHSWNIVGGNGTIYDDSKRDKEYARIDGKDGMPGYFRDGRLYTISFVDADIDPIVQRAGTTVTAPSDPTKKGYKFIGRDMEIPEKMPAENLTITAQWKKNGSSWSGGGGKKKDDCPNGDFSGSEYDGECGDVPYSSADDSTGNVQEPQNDSSVSSGAIAKNLGGEELFNMHQRAYENGLTIYKPGEDVKFDHPLTRQQMAKISSIFGAKFLNQKADASEKKVYECSQYEDLHKSKGEMRGYVIQSCLLGNMGYKYDNVHYIPKFMPYDKLTLAQASVIISRMAWGEKYIIDEGHWYQGHMKAVHDNGLIDDIKDPKRTITRGEAFMMLYKLDKLMNQK